MTADRAEAYGQVTRLLNAMAAAKLQPLELHVLREVADVCLFSTAAQTPDVDAALSAASGVLQHLADCGRWRPETAQHALTALEDAAGYHAHRVISVPATA